MEDTMSKSSKGWAAFGLSWVNMFLGAWVFMLLWGWFAPSLGFGPIGYWQAMGVRILGYIGVSLGIAVHLAVYSADDVDKRITTQVVNIVYLLMATGIGYIVHVLAGAS